jgi:hypothetical protein
VRFAIRRWVARASRVLAMASRHRGLFFVRLIGVAISSVRKDCFGETPKPTREVRAGRALRALPGAMAARSQQTRGLGKSAHQIHALNRLATRAFNDVVDCAHENDTVGPWVGPPRYVDEICANYIFGVGKLFVC